MDPRERLIFELGVNPVLAHATFFGERHAHRTPAFHKEIIDLWHSDEKNVLTMAFRGGAKSTLAEEAIVIEAALGRTRNCVILGESETRATERLRAIKHEFEFNEFIQAGLDVGPGDVWTDTKAILSNGVILQAYGRNQSLRGVKHINHRPDLIFMDDLEDKESVATPEARRKTRSWFTSTVMPALEPHGRMRMAATPLNPEALAVTLSKARSSWLAKVYPIIFKDADDRWQAMWPDRFPVEWALQRWEDMKEVGQGEDFMQEYLCQALDPASQTFTEEMFRVVPRQRSWQATYAIYDPARTTNKQSATTGKVVASWIGPKLVVWEATAKKWMPDEIVADMFDVDARYNPVAIGFEETGLNEWALQPIRAAQVQRGVTLPLRALAPPKGKLDFIRGLQPYFKSGEVEFAGDMPELRSQLLSFPTGAIDAPNALAYMLKLRLGLPVYENFQDAHVAPEPKPAPRSPTWLALNTNGQVVTAQLAQIVAGVLTVHADWLVEGDPGAVLPDIWQEAMLAASSGSAGPQAQGKGGGALTQQRAPRLIAPRTHFEGYVTVGLTLAAKRLTRDLTRGGDLLQGREQVRALMRRLAHGRPAFRVAREATWTLRALAGGYARDVDKTEPQENAYRVLMEGLEALAAMLGNPSVSDMDETRNYAYTADGRRYLSALAR